MTTETVFEKVTQGPGPIGPSTAMLLHAGEQFDLRITANLGTGANQWSSVDADGSPTLRVDLLTESSADGASWSDPQLHQITGGSFGKGGLLPSVGFRNDTGGDRFYRVTMTVNKNLPIGLNKETP